MNNIESHKKWSTNFLNNSKIVITEKDSKKEDSERSNKNKSFSNNSGRNNNNSNCNNIIIEGLLKTNESNFSAKKNRTIGSRLSHIASEHSLGGEKGKKVNNALRTNKSPKLFKKDFRDKKLEKFKLSYEKTKGNLNNSVDTFNKYKHLFGDVEGPAVKSNRNNNKSVQFKRLKESTTEEADLSMSITNKSNPRYKNVNSIFTFRREHDTLRNKNKRNDILGGMDEILQLSDMNIKRFHSNDLFK
jgi:hypothetical protein